MQTKLLIFFESIATYSLLPLLRFDRSRDDTLKFNTESSWLTFDVDFLLDSADERISVLVKFSWICINGIGLISKWINGGLLLFDCPPGKPPLLLRRVFSASSNRMPRICFTWNYMKMRMMLKLMSKMVHFELATQTCFVRKWCVNF